jgi:hypothetical protein
MVPNLAEGSEAHCNACQVYIDQVVASKLFLSLHRGHRSTGFSFAKPNGGGRTAGAQAV